MKKFKRRINWTRNLFSILYHKIRLLFGYKPDPSKIPNGLYCYVPDIEKNNKKDNDCFTYYTIPCEYYVSLGYHWNGCKYLGVITDDDVFADMCKMCDIKHYYIINKN